MSIRFDNTADYLSRASDLPDYNSAYTIMGWVYIAVDTNTNASFFLLDDGTANNRDYIRTTTSGTIVSLQTILAGSQTNTNGTDLAVGTWYHLALVRESATSLKMYLNGTLDASNTTNVAARSATTRMQVGSRAGSNPLDGRAAFVKVWTAGLTQAEVQAEMYAIRPMRMANLHLWTPLRSGARAKDFSGNGRDWTENGTLTDEDDPQGLFYGLRAIVVPGAAATGVAGTLAVTEADDTLSSTGALPLVGSLAQTEAADTVASAGALPLLGSAALAEDSDTLAAMGALPLVGASTLAEADDALAAAGALVLVGAAALAETDDSLVAAGSSGTTGMLGVAEGDDALAGTGALVLAGSLASQEDADSLAAAAVLPIVASLSVTEADDLPAETGALLIQGVATLSEANDLLAGTAILPIAGSGALIEAGDTMSGTATLAVTGIFAQIEDGDALLTTGMLFIRATALLSEADDTLSATSGWGDFYIPADRSVVLLRDTRAVVLARDTRTAALPADTRTVEA